MHFSAVLRFPSLLYVDLGFNPKDILVLFEERIDHLVQICVDLLFRASHIFCRIHRLLQILQAEVERRVIRDQLKKVIVQSFLLHILSCFHGELPDPFVKLLSVPSFFDRDEIYGMYFAPRDQAEKIDTIFAALLFESLIIPSLSGSTAEIGAEFERSLQILETELADLNRRMDAFFAKERETARALYAALAGAETLFGLRSHATRCKDAYILTGLIPAEHVSDLQTALRPCKNVYVVKKGCVRQRVATA